MIRYPLKSCNLTEDICICARCGKETKLEYKTKLCPSCYRFFVKINRRSYEEVMEE
jgi:NMD protein affecting ribosome stability and mRNA decay